MLHEVDWTEVDIENLLGYSENLPYFAFTGTTGILCFYSITFDILKFWVLLPSEGIK